MSVHDYVIGSLITLNRRLHQNQHHQKPREHDSRASSVVRCLGNRHDQLTRVLKRAAKKDRESGAGCEVPHNFEHETRLPTIFRRF